MHWRTTILTLLLLACPAWADLKITGDLRVHRDRMVRLTADGAAAGSAIIWDINNEDTSDLEELPGRLLFSGTPGIYKVKCRSIVLDKDGKTKIETARATVEIYDPAPPPPPPVPPPGPGPGPGPAPGPAPIPDAGFRVLVLYKASDLGRMPPAQESILYAKAIRDYLDQKCILGPDGRTRDWRIWDQGVDATAESPLWQAALKRPRASAPWIVISDGKTGFEGPLPLNVDDTLTLLKKYGG